MDDSEFNHVNQQDVHTRMLTIRDRLGELAEIKKSIDGLNEREQYEVGQMFGNDMTLFAFMDEKPGHSNVNGRPPAGERGGPGCYFDGQGREGWHRILRQLRNESDPFWAGLHGAPLGSQAALG